MRASVATCRNPFSPSVDRDVRIVHRRHRVRTLAPKTDLPFICIYNGEPLLRENWNRQIADGDLIVFVTLPQGGGGGSSPLRIILSIALSYAAPGWGTMLADSMGAAGMGFMASDTIFGVSIGQIFGGAISMVGNALLGALLPSPKPPAPYQSGSFNIASPSPTYNINAQGNSARLGEAIPVIYGQHLIYPDFAAQPYTEYDSNEQYLYQLHTIGLGEYEINAINVEDSPIANFPEVTYEIYQPGQAVTLFPVNVTTATEVSGQEILNSYIGGFIVNPSQTQANKLAVDVICPRGLYYANDEGGLNSVSVIFNVDARPVDDNGTPTGSYVTIGSHTISGATTTPIRKTYRYDVALGRYQVRVVRNDTKQTDSRYGHEIDWVSARAYIPGAQSYPNMTTLAIRMRASNSLSATASKRINCLVSRKLPIWNGTSWSAPTETRSIAWALADIIRNDYGANAADSRIDLAQLLALDNTWTIRGDYFDGVFDSTVSTWDALTSVARVGRTKPFMQGGVVHFVRDQAQTLPVALFTNRNIKKGSFKTSYIMTADETADSVIVEYFNGITWKPDEVEAHLPSSTTDQPARIKLFGCTSKQRAWKEGMYMAAANRYRRQLITFQTEMDGFIPTFGDLIAISHDRPDWGVSGEVVGWDVPTKTLTLSQAVEFTAGTHHIALRKRDGSFDGPYTVTAGPNEFSVVLSVLPSFTPYTGSAEEKTYFAFGKDEAYRREARVVSVRPRSSETVEIVCVNEDAAVHTADTSATPPDSSYWNLPAKITRPAVSGLTVSVSGNTTNSMVVAAWLPAATATYYVVQLSYDAGTSWQTVGSPTQNHFEFVVKPGAIKVRVAAVGMAQGNWTEWTGTPFSSTPALPGVLNLALVQPFVGTSAGWKWDAVAGATYYTVTITAASAVRRTIDTTDTSFAYSWEDALADGGPWRTLTIGVTAKSDTSASAAPATLTSTNPQIATPSGVSAQSSPMSVEVRATMPTDPDYAGMLIYGSTSSGFTPGSGNLLYSGIENSHTFAGLAAGTARYYKIAFYDKYGVDSLNFSSEISATPLGAGGVSIVSSLPVSGIDGDVVSLTTDHKLYRWNQSASAWQTWVDGSDILASSITGGKIAASTITASNINVANLGSLSASLGTVAIGTDGYLRAGKTSYSDTTAGYWLGYDATAYKFKIGSGSQYVAWDGSALNVAANLVGATGTFSGALSAATGTYSGTLTASAVNAVNTINLAGNAVTVPNGAFTAGSMSLSTGWQTVQSVTISCTGQKLYISAEATLLQDQASVITEVYARILVNGADPVGAAMIAKSTQIPDVNNGGYTYSLCGRPGLGYIVAAPASGTITIALQMYFSPYAGAGVTASQRSIFTMECKR